MSARCFCYVTLSLIPSGLNLCQIVKKVHMTYETLIFIPNIDSSTSHLYSKCKIITLTWLGVRIRCGVRWGVNSRKFFPRSCNWECTLKNPCCGGWKISGGRLLPNILLVKIHGLCTPCQVAWACDKQNWKFTVCYQKIKLKLKDFPFRRV